MMMMILAVVMVILTVMGMSEMVNWNVDELDAVSMVVNWDMHGHVDGVVDHLVQIRRDN